MWVLDGPHIRWNHNKLLPPCLQQAFTLKIPEVEFVHTLPSSQIEAEAKSSIIQEIVLKTEDHTSEIDVSDTGFAV